MNKKQSLPGIINGFHGKNILVIGDFILDVYLKGSCTRLSPEAPVPVVDIAERTSFLGGAANAVCNLKSLGARVDFFSVIGNDPESAEVTELMRKNGIERNGILQIADRKTIVKTRIVSGAHVITRLDQGTETELDEGATAFLIKMISEKYQQYDAVIISDYNKGVVTQPLLDAIKNLQTKHAKFLAVDSKRLPFFQSLRPSLVKPNYDEAVRLLSLPQRFTGRADQMKAAVPGLYKKLKATIIAVTLDSEGSLIAEKGSVVHRCFAPSVAMPYVSGAGDTYLSAFVLSYICSHDNSCSADIATAAAAIAVEKESTSSCSNKELKAYFNVNDKYVSSPEELKEICDRYHTQGKKIVFTNGCFDILHSGHVTYLHQAKRLGDILITGVNNDESIKRLKGASRPIIPLSDRLQVLAGLSSVNHVIQFGDIADDTPISLIKLVRPHVFAKGEDYTKSKLPEAGIIEALGGEIIFVPYIPDHSTTEIVNRITDATMPGQSLNTAMYV